MQIPHQVMRRAHYAASKSLIRKAMQSAHSSMLRTHAVSLLTGATLKYRLLFGFRLTAAGPSGVNSPPRPSQDVGDN